MARSVCAGAAAHHKDDMGGETGPAANARRTEKDKVRKKLEEWRGCRAFSGNFPRRYYPDRVQRVSLSLAA